MSTLKVYNLQTVDESALSKFFSECQALGYENNISKSAVRTEFVLQRNGNIWFLARGNEILGMAGCHRFDEQDPTSFRIQYRGCELPGKDVKPGLSRSQFNASTFRELIPYQLKWVEEQGYDKNNTYITVNHGNKNHRTMQLIERQGFLTKINDIELFGKQQTVWKFNTQHYEHVRSKITSYVA